LTQELAKTVKRISLNTKVAIGFVPQNEKDYFVYDKDWSLSASEELSKYAKGKGKELWMLETWLHYLPSTGMPWKKEIEGFTPAFCAYRKAIEEVRKNER